MIRLRRLGLTAVASLALAGVALAQSAGVSGQGDARTATEATAHDAKIQSTSSSSASANAQVDLGEMRKQIAARASKTSAKVRARAETQIEAVTASVRKSAANESDDKIASRLASEFDLSTQAVLEEKHRLDASWSELVIAHTLAANSQANLTVDPLVQWRRDGMGWADLAAGLGLNLGSVVSGIQSESRVASGQAKADGKVAVIQGVGTRAGLGANTGLGVGASGAATGVQVGGGLRIGH